MVYSNVMIGRLIDKFQVIEHLGNGHFGHVYLCFDPYLQKELAIKVIKLTDPDHFVEAVKEGRALDSCRHKHIVDVKDVRSATLEGEQVVIIIMEYLAKGSIQKRLEKRFVSCKESTKIMQDVLLGLEHAHNTNVLHRDIKPGNIMIGDSGEAKLSDFGLAIDYHSEVSDSAGYRPHQPLEVIEGNPMNKLSDIYATGITYYRLLNNISKLPFTFANRAEWLKAVKKDLYPPRTFLPHIPERLIKILNKSIHKSTSTRFKDCTSFRQAIEKVQFYVDWIMVDDNTWTGNDGNDSFEIIKYRKRTGWFIDLKKNGIKRTQYCMSQVPDMIVEHEFFKVIKETTLRS
jgi:eukaryotic-like serine/threonine-protein kinase